MPRFKDKLKPYKDLILEGRMLAIDPSSGNKESRAGYALFDKGELLESGTIPVDNKLDTVSRLRQMANWTEAFVDCYGVNVVAIEMLRAGVHTSLRWAVAAFFIATDPCPIIEVPAVIWHRLAGKEYVKSDEKDAIEIGKTCIWQAEEWKKEPKTGGTRLKGLGEQTKAQGAIFKRKKRKTKRAR